MPVERGDEHGNAGARRALNRKRIARRRDHEPDVEGQRFLRRQVDHVLQIGACTRDEDRGRDFSPATRGGGLVHAMMTAGPQACRGSISPTTDAVAPAASMTGWSFNAARAAASAAALSAAATTMQNPTPMFRVRCASSIESSAASAIIATIAGRDQALRSNRAAR